MINVAITTYPTIQLPSGNIFLISAFYLAGLTYFLGVIFYALPIPVEGVKQWAPKLIKDAIYVLVWISIYQYVIDIARGVLDLTGYSWNGYFIFLTGFTALTSFLYTVLVIIKVAPQIIISILTSIFVPAQAPSVLSKITSIFNFFYGGGLLTNEINNLQIILLSLYSIMILSDLIFYGLYWLISFGIFLMSLPFRIGRHVGATVISATLVFYVGLPPMQYFINQVLTNGLGQFGISVGITTLAGISAGITDPVSIGITLLFIIPIMYESFVVVPLAYIITLSVISIGLGDIIAETAGQFPFPIKIF